MITPWCNTVVKIQRRDVTAIKNVLGELDYGDESAYTTIYPTLNVRFEFEDARMEFNESGERVVPKLYMYVEDGSTVLPMDRITVVSSDDTTLLDQSVYKILIAVDIFPEWDSMGNLHHYMVECEPH